MKRLAQKAGYVIAAGLVLSSCVNVPVGRSSSEPTASTSTTPTGGRSPSISHEPWNRPNAGKRYTPGKTLKPLTENGDLSCANLVAPYELTSNLEILRGLGVEGFFEAARQMWETIIRGTSADLAAKTVETNAKHNIPYKLRAAAYQMNWVPMELEVAYGEELARRLKEAGEIEPDDSESGPKLYAAADELLVNALSAVSGPHPYEFRAVVTTRAGQNAEALPGGLILIDPALLTDRSLSRKARFAMSHEIGHVLQRHQTRAMQARIIDSVSLRGSLTDLAKVMGESKSSPKAVISLVLAGKLQFEKFFVEQELHSDGCAVRILNHTQPSHAELIAVIQDFVKRLPKPTEGRSEPVVPAGSMRSTLANIQRNARDADALIDLVTRPVERHPTTAERVKNLNDTLGKIRQETRGASAKKQ